MNENWKEKIILHKYIEWEETKGTEWNEVRKKKNKILGSRGNNKLSKEWKPDKAQVSY